MESDRALSRRALLRMLAGTAAAVMTAPVLAACGGESAPETNTPPAGGGTSSGGTTASPAGGGTPSGGATASPATGSASASPVAGGSLTVYSGRSQELVSQVVERFKAASGVDVDVRYGDTAELAAAILEEGKNSPADVFFAQDAGALGAIAREDLFAPLPDDMLNRVESRFRSPEGLWVGVSGRARAVVYNTERRSEADIPTSILDFTDPAWKGRLGWAPSNGS
ncbi:MAG TPA: extracellular solute-binding protein, partial [Gemmatimonadales bacterium]